MEETKISHYHKYKETIDKSVKKYLENPENRLKHNAVNRRYREKKKKEFEEMKAKLEEIQKLVY